VGTNYNLNNIYYARSEEQMMRDRWIFHLDMHDNRCNTHDRACADSCSNSIWLVMYDCSDIRILFPPLPGPPVTADREKDTNTTVVVRRHMLLMPWTTTFLQRGLPSWRLPSTDSAQYTIGGGRFKVWSWLGVGAVNYNNNINIIHDESAN